MFPNRDALSRPTPFKILFLAVLFCLIGYMVIVLVGLAAYPPLPALIESLASPEIIAAVELSLVTSAVSTALCILVAVPVAYSLARFSFPGKSVANTLMNLPLALPPLVAGVALLIFYGPSTFGKMLSSLGLDVVYTPLGIIVAQFFVNVPYMIRVTRSAFETINPRYEHVARTLGCTEWGAFRQVTLPLARNGLVAGLVITWSKSIGEFGAVLMLAGATQMKTETLPIALYLNMSTGDLDLAIAASVILIVIAMASLLIFERCADTRGIF
ncbi:ABC transporter permease [Methanoculleus sp.]|uniref:NifC-like ABC-type porter n=1 Tax=Methanoculleus marisnigri TaxID=2198 RepID=A0A101GSD1_9EURY|nr:MULTISPECIES: ABC transporter permease [Methanoculleus]KUK63330.1 MAG: NifC-like ABC-type porter [Methanoculleus marisnigri]KUL03086.1 MAG: NifC-like ABC-type porter [Methanoculleus marisnigri]